ncbi:MAG: GNAT family N-acetyltransferase [Dehalococcoidia bacterium]
MLATEVQDQVDGFWCTFFGCSREQLRGPKSTVVGHPPARAADRGVHVLQVTGAAPVVSLPEDLTRNHGNRIAAAFRNGLPTHHHLHVLLETRFDRFFGPAWLGYASVVAPGEVTPGLRIRALHATDASKLNDLLEASPASDRANVASLPSANFQVGGFFGEHLVSVAGYQEWDGRIAHIAVLTRSEYRGRGFGRAVVRAIGRAALNRGFIPQYRALMENAPSRAVALAEGFEAYGRMLVLR